MNLFETVQLTGMLALYTFVICAMVTGVMCLALLVAKILHKQHDKVDMSWQVPKYMELFAEEIRWLGTLQTKLYPNQVLVDSISNRVTEIMSSINKINQKPE